MNGTIFTLRNLYRDGTICLEKAGIADAKLDAWYLLEYETKISRAMFLADPDKEVEKDKAEHYRKDIETRAQRIPLQHITGEQEFMGLPFCVNEHVLIPRQDTEVLVEEAIRVIQKEMPEAAVLDLCTGSGFCDLFMKSCYTGDICLVNLCDHITILDSSLHRRRISLYFPDINAFRDSLFAGKLLHHYNSVNANIRNSLSICQKFDLFLDIRNRIGTYKISVSLQI